MSTEPTLAEIIRIAIAAALRETFTAFVGRVVTYTPGVTGPPVVDVQPVTKRALPGSDGSIVHETLPIVPNVPVVFPGASAMSLTWPIAAGDHVLCVCTNWSHQQWRESGTLSNPGDLRTHELGNAFAIAGVLPKNGVLPTDATAAVFEVSDVVKVGAGAADFVAMNQKVLDEIALLHQSVKDHHHLSGGSGSASGLALWTPTSNEYDPSADVAATKLKSE